MAIAGSVRRCVIRGGGERQEAASPDARARSAAKAAAALSRHYGQRPCRTVLCRLSQRRRSRASEPALAADLTYVAIPGGFVYLAAVLDAWSRKVVG